MSDPSPTRLHESLEAWRHLVDTWGCESVEEALALPEDDPIRRDVAGQVKMLGHAHCMGFLKRPVR